MTDFEKALRYEVKRQKALEKYYDVVMLSQSEDNNGFPKEERVEFRKGNIANDSYSVSKSVTTVALGILYDRGLIKPDSRISDYLGCYFDENTDSAWKTMTVDNVLRHRTGAAYGIDLDFAETELWEDKEWLHRIFSIPSAYEAGKNHIYSDGNYYVISRIVEKLCGCDLECFMQREVFAPMNFHGSAWSRDVMGHTLGGTGLFMRTLDMAKIAWLYMNNGKWGDRQIVSHEWTALAEDTQKDEYADYAYGLGRSSDGKSIACGMFGQGFYYSRETRRAYAWHAYDADGLIDFCDSYEKMTGK